jgi:hypothetical protein
MMKIFIYTHSLNFFKIKREVLNRMRKITFLIATCIITSLSLPLVTAENTANNTGPEFEVGIYPGIGFGLNFHGFEISVKNIGDSTAHNVTLTNLSIEGNVLYNNRVTGWHRDIDPGVTMLGYPNNLFLGLGRFTATMTVTCDEGITGTGSGNGFIFGPFIIVP